MRILYGAVTMGEGRFARTHDVVPGEVALWLEARRMVRKRWPDAAAAFMAWVAAGRPESPLDFSARLWEETRRLAAGTA